MNKLTVLFFLFIILSCTPSGNQLSRADEIKWKQYRAKGESLYQLNCSNCHGPSGEGLVKLYPPLQSVDWIGLNAAKISCVIKNGIRGEIMINNSVFTGEMPGHADLTNLEIAEITAFIMSDLNGMEQFYDVNEIIRQLAQCED